MLLQSPGTLKVVLMKEEVLRKCSGLAKLTSVDFCNIDLRDRFGRTPLMYAVLGNYPACVEVREMSLNHILFWKLLLKMFLIFVKRFC